MPQPTGISWWKPPAFGSWLIPKARFMLPVANSITWTRSMAGSRSKIRMPPRVVLVAKVSAPEYAARRAIPMLDCFALLEQPRRPWLDSETLKNKFLDLSARVHPDRVHQASEAERKAAHA